jgi:WD40 repeat protein
MYNFSSDIRGDGDNSFIPDVSFHPNGSIFAVCYRKNQIRIFDSATRKLLRTYQTQEAQLDWPHGLLLTTKHMIVSNKLTPPIKPSILNVYRLDDPSEKPVTTLVTPIEHLREAHSLALHGQRLVITYCGKTDSHAIVSYHFDDATGKISGPLDIIESWFIDYGDPKGICFNEEGTKVIVSFVTEKKITRDIKKKGDVLNKFRRAWLLLREENGAQKLVQKVFLKFLNLLSGQREKGANITNGLVIFDVDNNGILTKEPSQILLNSGYCRLENISIVGSLCAVADPVNDTVKLYNFDGKQIPDAPIQVIRDHLSFPHDACLSPDKKMLVVTNYGIKVIDDEIQWESFYQPRQDNIAIYELQESTGLA